MEHPHFVVAFDIGRESYRAWPSGAFGLLFLAIGVIWWSIAWRVRNAQGIRRGRICTAFAACWVIAAFGSSYRAHWALRRDLLRGHYEIAEGRVEDFASGKKGESFRVGDHRYSYSENDVTSASTP
ncbi:MAG: hypothetical protein JOZ54_11720 [Acidobacteria bacterium]|nr:hypothetical protein [Acidobacteriota bacterium]